MGDIKKISKETLDNVLKNNERQYLVGNLKSPQMLPHIHDNNVEVGISHYKDFTADKPHIHKEVTEYQMILQGRSEIKNLLTEEVIKLHEGDFYIVNKETPYAQKSAANTKIIFFKYPSLNDKQVIEIDAATEFWLKIEI
ncbi:cupin [Bacillus sp. B1-b2]|uniref:cupin n=1 Tax=Bacillus sp. B1-b2 TaxID=2653201 RepID=UPI00126160C7|nr:cupin [Bacillus sp. B1-b2]KAB7665278.1 cupin domain-containing protein [Bacillus sp. B1-b2]